MKNSIKYISVLFLSIAMAACSSDDDDASSSARQIDRMGRPAINTALINTFTSDSVRGNAENVYNATLYTSGSNFITEMAANLAIYDALVDEGANGNACGDNPLTNLASDLSGLATGPTRYTFLATVLSEDQLYVDSSQGSPCAEYLAVERNVLGGTLNDCGGRAPTVDVIDATYSAVATGLASAVPDGVAVTDDDSDLSDSVFPFLGAPL